MHENEAFEPDAKTPEVVQPGNGTLNDPSGLAEAAARFATAGNVRGNASGM
ncbi:hypothetical protein HDG38_003960 [Paraburkholderia sp. WSM4177]|nr:hypothetical protein [Paraburkholderia sp. WSM4177]MBB5485879.1 hypothetical protein [Paraburkholderia sp. WSM4180]